MNLLTKLSESFNNIKEETKKRFIASILTGGIAISSLGMTGCTSCNTDPNNTNPPIINPGDNGPTINPGDNNGGNNSNTQTPDYSKYSQILQNVLTDKYYKNLINDDMSYSFKRAFNHPSYQPIPYGFLEDEGFDINKFKNKNLSCTSELYSINNDLYIEVKAENESSTNYLTNYVLKYSLTDKELGELKKLFTSVDFYLGEATYYQASFFVQELSYLKDPEIISTAYLTKFANISAREHFDAKKYLSKSHICIYLGSTYKENSNVAFHTYQIRPIIYSPEMSSKIATIVLGTNGYGRIAVDGKYIHNTELKSSGILTDENKISFENSVKNITAYTTSSLYFQDIKTNGDFKKVLGD